MLRTSLSREAPEPQAEPLCALCGLPAIRVFDTDLVCSACLLAALKVPA